MKKAITLLGLLWLCVGMASAYDFSATTPSGHTLYYRINNGAAEVVRPDTTSSWSSYVTGNLIIPDSVTYSGVTYPVTTLATINNHGSFYGCDGLLSVVIPNTVTTIDDYAFFDCIYMTSVTIGTGVTTIGWQAFSYCSSLNSIFIPANVTNMNSNSFHGCGGLTSISVASGNTVYDSRNNCNALIETASNTLILGCKNTVIPNNITTIGNGAFYRCGGLTSIVIPSSVSYVSRYAFGDCDSLTSIVVSSGNTVYDSRNNCNAIINTAENMLVAGCKNTTIPEGVTSIGVSAFYMCSGMPSITLPASLTHIHEEAFYGCDDLTDIRIPDNVTYVGYRVFFRCYDLASVTIGRHVLSIGEKAFEDCASLATINSLDTVPPTLGTDAFLTVPTNISVYVPCGSATAYNAADGWSNFTNIQERRYIFSATSANPQMGSVQIITAPNCTNDQAEIQANPSGGYHFVNWSDGVTDSHRIVEVTQDTALVAYFDLTECDPITQFPWNNTFDENLSCWRIVDADGDGYNWGYYQGWAVSESYSYFDGSNQSLAPDNWLISRQIQLPASGNCTLAWTAKGLNNSFYDEHYSVYLSNGGNNTSDFATSLYGETLSTPNAVNRSVSLNNYRGQTIRIAFRHHNSDDVFILGIANVKITVSTQGIDDVEEGDVSVYAKEGNIYVETDLSEDINVYDIVGHKVDGGRKSQFTVPASGVYMVKIGGHSTRKVVVIK